MISKQKAKRIAYGIVYDVVAGADIRIGLSWNDAEHGAIQEAIEKIVAELKKKSQ